MKRIVITISREYGSGGRLIAKQLSEKMGITFYDKQLIAEVAKKTGFSENFIRDTEHQRPTNSFLFDLYTTVVTPSVPDQVFIAQAKVIKQAAAKESCVIVGRCADYILREHKDLLRVFIYAPMEERIRRAVEEYGDKESNMESFVTRKDKQCASYYNYFTSVRWGDRKSYDLCINSALGLDTAVELIRTAALAREGQKK